MKKRIVRALALVTAVCVLMLTAGCGESAPKAGEYVFDYELDSFIADFNDYLRVIISDGKDEETAQVLYDAIKLTKGRFSSVDDESHTILFRSNPLYWNKNNITIKFV